VDPFFRKTTQLFDEASSRGLLLNNLPINTNHLLSLDATAKDSALVVQETNEMQEKPTKSYLKYVTGGDKANVERIWKTLETLDLCPGFKGRINDIINGGLPEEQEEVKEKKQTRRFERP
jgi:hypothetical protein